jgi:hypothetical protein
MARVTTFLLTALFAAGCGGDSTPTGPDGTPTPTGSQGTLAVRLTDSPYGSAKAVLVTFSDVSAHKDGNWTKLPFAGGSSTRTCDLKKLQNSNEDVLGTGGLNPGSYTMVRLVVQSATIYFDNSAVSATPCAASIAAPAGASANLPIPSGEVRLNGTFTITAGVASTMLLDYDGESSIKDLGNGSYRMEPVIRIIRVQ